MSIIGKKIIDRKTGDVGTVLSVSYKFVKDGFMIQVRVEFEYEGDYITLNRNIKNVVFLGDET
jgi:hypothetical protein